MSDSHHPDDPPDLGRHYADRAERSIRRANEHRDDSGNFLSDAERLIRGVTAIAEGMIGLGERALRVAYALNRIHRELEVIREQVTPPEVSSTLAAEIARRDLLPEDLVAVGESELSPDREDARTPVPEAYVDESDPGPNGIGPEREPVIVEPLRDPVPPGWTPTTGESGAPRMAPVDRPQRECKSCHHDTHYAPGPDCQHPDRHNIPF